MEEGEEEEEKKRREKRGGGGEKEEGKRRDSRAVEVVDLGTRTGVLPLYHWY